MSKNFKNSPSISWYCSRWLISQAVSKVPNRYCAFILQTANLSGHPHSNNWNARHIVSTGTKSYMLHDCWPWSFWQFVKRRMHELIYAYAHTNNYLSFSTDTIDDASTLGLTKRRPPYCRTTIRVCPHESSVCEQPCQNSHEDWAKKLLSSVQTHDSLIYTSIILS